MTAAFAATAWAAVSLPPHKYSGPYSNLTSVTLMIAREMMKEILCRRDRMKAHIPAEQRGFFLRHMQQCLGFRWRGIGLS